MTGSQFGRAWLALIAACCVLIAAGCVPPTLDASAAATTPKARGQILYARCSGCHAGAGLDLRTLPFSKIKEGLRKPAMSAFKDMSDDDIGALMAYLATLN
jgi:mono/diheme cytochrome c family protein